MFVWPVVLQTIFFYGVILVAAFVAWRRLRRNRRDLLGLAAIGVLLLFPVVIGIQLYGGSAYKSEREEEIAAWPRIQPPDPLPQALVVVPQMRGGEYPDYVLSLAEAEIFDVYQWDQRRGKMWHVEVAEREDCARRRTSDNRFTALTGFLRCADLMPVDALPQEGLYLYEGVSQAPLAPESRDKAYPNDPRQPVDWVMQLSWRHNGIEELIAYEESMRGLRLVADPWIGVRVARDSAPMQKLSPTLSTTLRPRVDLFLFAALNIDPDGIRPPGTLKATTLRPAIDNLIAAGDKPSTLALGKLAAHYPEPDPLIADGLMKAMSNPKTAKGLWLHPIECELVSSLSRYRSAIRQGCERNPNMPDSCGISADADTWFEMCTDSTSAPIWSEPDPTRSRIAVSLVFTGLESAVSPTSWPQRDWGVVEVVVPSDRGMIDIAFWDENIWHFAGAVSCIGTVTVIGDKGGVVGLPPEKVQFRGDSFGRYRGDSGQTGALSKSIQALLGGEPDVTIVDHRNSVLNLGAILPSEAAKGSCPSGTHQPPLTVVDGKRVDIDPDQLLLVPTVVPVRLPE